MIIFERKYFRLYLIMSVGIIFSLTAPSKVFHFGSLFAGLALTAIVTFYIFLMIRHEEKINRLVEERTRELSEANEKLNNEIAERTVIEQQIREEKERLQTFQNVTVNREVEMIELKKENNELRRRLGEIPSHDLTFLEKRPFPGQERESEEKSDEP